MAYTNLTGAMTEAQFGYLCKLITAVYTDPGLRAEYLINAAGHDKASASAAIEKLKPLAKSVPAPAVEMPAYVAPFGHYMINGDHVQLKKAKYGDAVYVIKNETFLGTLGKSAAATAAIAALDSATAAYAAVVEFAKVTSKCGVCHTKLTDPKSIAAGIGPVCAKKYGMTI